MKCFIFSSLVFLFAFVCIHNVEAGFSNNGRMQSKNLNLSVGGTLDNNGELIGTESAHILCETLSGKGLIRSPQISIKTNIFAFTGTIDCDGQCTIITSTPFNKKIFKRKGGGEFIIIVDENLANTSAAQMESSIPNYNITDGLLMQVD